MSEQRSKTDNFRMRSSMAPRSDQQFNLDFSSKGMQDELNGKDRQISELKSIISKLEMKSKELSLYESMLADYEAKFSQQEAETLRIKEQLRQKNLSHDSLALKLKALGDHPTHSLNTPRDEQKKLKHENNQLRNHNSQYQQEIGELRKVIEDQETQIRNLKSNLNNKNQQIFQARNAKRGHEGERQKNQLACPNIDITSPTSAERSDRANWQLKAVTTERDEYRNKCRDLQANLNEYLHSSQQWSTRHKNSQLLEKIKQYEEHIQSMASTISTIHQLEMEKNSIEKERQQLKIESDSLKEENYSLKVHLESLEDRIRMMQQYREHTLESDMRRFVMQNEDLAKQLDSFLIRLNQKSSDVEFLKDNYIKIHRLYNEQMLEEMNQTLNNLEEALSQSRDRLTHEQNQHCEEQEKCIRLQREMKNKEIEYNETRSESARLNRVISQKMQKIEFQSLEIKRLQGENQEKLQLSQRLAKLQKTHKETEQCLNDKIDESNELLAIVLVMAAELDRSRSTTTVTPDLIKEIQSLNAKALENEDYSHHIEERIKRLEHLHKMVCDETAKVSEQLHMSHKRWNHYDTSMQQLTDFLQTVSERTEKNYEEMDSTIQSSLKRREENLSQLRDKEDREWEKAMQETKELNQSRINQNKKLIYESMNHSEVRYTK